MKRREEGFILIEIIIAVAIMGAIMVPMTMTTASLLQNHQRATDHNIVLCQVQNAGCWISYDVQMAKNVIFDEPSGFPLTLDIPIDTDENNDNRVVYTFDSNKLNRQIYDSSETLIAETLIAECISVDDTTFGMRDTTIYELNVKASKDNAVAERSYEIVPRTGSR